MGKIISIYGPAASGKTTQAIKLANTFGLNQFSMGDTLRSIIESGSELGKKIKYQVENGILIDDDNMRQVLSQAKELAKTGIIFDGFPRILSQAYMIEEVLADTDSKLEKVFLLKINEGEIIKRIKIRSQAGDRPDDLNPEAVAKRIEVFNQESKSLIDLYRGQGLLVEIDGAKTPDEVFQEICSHLE